MMRSKIFYMLKLSLIPLAILLFCAYTVFVYDLGKLTVLAEMMDRGIDEDRGENPGQAIELYLSVIAFDSSTTKAQAKHAKELLAYLHTWYVALYVATDQIDGKHILFYLNQLRKEDREELIAGYISYCEEFPERCDASFWRKRL